jgi:hypothetical protein
MVLRAHEFRLPIQKTTLIVGQRRAFYQTPVPDRSQNTGPSHNIRADPYLLQCRIPGKVRRSGASVFSLFSLYYPCKVA